MRLYDVFRKKETQISVVSMNYSIMIKLRENASLNNNQSNVDYYHKQNDLNP